MLLRRPRIALARSLTLVTLVLLLLAVAAAPAQGKPCNALVGAHNGVWLELPTLGAPAVGDAIVITAPPCATVDLLAINFTLQTDADAAGKAVIISLDHGDGTSPTVIWSGIMGVGEFGVGIPGIDAFDGEPAGQTWRLLLETTATSTPGYLRDWSLSICYTVPPVCVEPPSSCTRADVAAVIYGGWDGIPVKAYAGGTEQPTMYTAHDAFGNPAVLWTFYPPASGWNVSVAPQVPAGLDPARWQYKLLSIRSNWPASTAYGPASASATITPCTERVFYFQLVDTGALPK